MLRTSLRHLSLDKRKIRRRMPSRARSHLAWPVPEQASLKLPILWSAFGPPELLSQRLGKELLDGAVELLAEDDCKTRIDVVDL